jgi:hypothetical protein
VGCTDEPLPCSEAERQMKDMTHNLRGELLSLDSSKDKKRLELTDQILELLKKNTEIERLFPESAQQTYLVLAYQNWLEGRKKESMEKTEKALLLLPLPRFQIDGLLDWNTEGVVDFDFFKAVQENLQSLEKKTRSKTIKVSSISPKKATRSKYLLKVIELIEKNRLFYFYEDLILVFYKNGLYEFSHLLSNGEVHSIQSKKPFSLSDMKAINSISSLPFALDFTTAKKVLSQKEKNEKFFFSGLIEKDSVQKNTPDSINENSKTNWYNHSWVWWVGGALISGAVGLTLWRSAEPSHDHPISILIQ